MHLRKESRDETEKKTFRLKRKKQQQKRRRTMTSEQLESKRKADRESKKAKRKQKKLRETKAGKKREQNRLAQQRSRAKEPDKRRREHRDKVTVPANCKRFQKFLDEHSPKLRRRVEWKEERGKELFAEVKRNLAADNLKAAESSINSLCAQAFAVFTWSTDVEQSGKKISVSTLRQYRIKTVLTIR